MSPENVRVNVRELGTKPSETSQKRGAYLADSFGSCRLPLYGVYGGIALLRKLAAGHRRRPGQPC